MWRVPRAHVRRIATTSRESIRVWVQLLVDILVRTRVRALAGGPSVSCLKSDGYTVVQTLVTRDMAWKSMCGSCMQMMSYSSWTLWSVASCAVSNFLVFCCQILMDPVFSQTIIHRLFGGIYHFPPSLRTL